MVWPVTSRTEINLMSVSPNRLLEDSEVKLSTAPVKITIGAEKFAVPLNFEARFDRDV